MNLSWLIYWLSDLRSLHHDLIEFRLPFVHRILCVVLWIVEQPVSQLTATQNVGHTLGRYCDTDARV
jgi:hypothetical protein